LSRHYSLATKKRKKGGSFAFVACGREGKGGSPVNIPMGERLKEKKKEGEGRKEIYVSYAFGGRERRIP